MHAKINATIGKVLYRTEITANTNVLISDEPIDLGGKDAGFSPTELLASALAACTCATLRMYADRKQWPLESVEVEVTFDRNAQLNTSNLHRTIKVVGALDVAQKERLLTIANSCPLHKTLTNPITIASELIA